MERVYIASDPSEAVIVQSRLAAVGIESKVIGDDLYHLRGVIPIEESTLPTLYVHLEDLVNAKQVIEEYKVSLTVVVSGEPWICPGCKESLDPQFSACWSCGTVRE